MFKHFVGNGVDRAGGLGLVVIKDPGSRKRFRTEYECPIHWIPELGSKLTRNLVVLFET